MAGLIPQSFIDNLLDRVDIVEIVDHRVKLKKTGKNYSACCPFHDEKSPSFTVSPEKQFFYCFGCGASGNALGFIMDYERLAFPEAVEQLARVAGLEVPREERSQAQIQREEEKRSIYTLLEKADTFYQTQLRQHPSKQMAVAYLKGRGLDGKIAKDYGVGFAPPGWDNLLKALATNDEDKHLLIEGGMLIHQPDEKKIYDRFRHRIMFPIRDTRGRVIGFGGRVLGDDKPKYLNSPETPVFHKGQELYGLYEARLAYRDLPRLLVVEGYMDVVSLAQFGIRYGVATLGTACGEDHLERAFRHTSEVVFCFDGDKAGRNAAHRALESSLSSMKDGRQVKFLFLPDGEDPDTLVRQIGPEKFEHMINLAVPLEDYLFDAVAEGLNIRTMEGRATFSRRAAPLLHRLPKGVFRELMFENLASRTGLSRSVLQELINEPTPEPENIAEASNETRAQKPAAPIKSPERPQQDASDYDYQMLATEDYAEYAAPPPEYNEYYAEPPSQQRTPKRQYQPDLSPSAPRKHFMPLARKAIALLMINTDLAAEEQDHAPWLNQDEPDWLIFGRLLKLLHERANLNYNISHILGYWRGKYGETETSLLGNIAANDLLRSTYEMAQGRKDKPPKIQYDSKAAFVHCIKRFWHAQDLKKGHLSLERIRNTSFTQLSKEERQQLVDDVLKNKMPLSE